MTDEQKIPINAGRKQAIKRLAVFQLKLAVDALRDVLLSPLSLLCTLMDVVEGKFGSDSSFEKLLDFGRRTERKINLFQQHDSDITKGKNLDSLIEQVETIIVKEYSEGQVSAKAKTAMDKALQLVRAAREKASQSGSNSPPK